MKSSRVEDLVFGCTARHLRLNGPLLLSASHFAVQTRLSVNVLFLVFHFLFVFLLAEAADAVLSVRAGWHPQAGRAVLHRLVLRRKVDAFAGLTVHAVLVPALGKVARTGRELGLDGCVGGHPVGEGIFTVLDDTAQECVSDGRWIEFNDISYALLASYPS